MSASFAHAMLLLSLALLACSLLSDAHTASAAAAPPAPYAYPLSAVGSRIVDASNRTVQLRCANWPGHMETMLPEGLQWQPLSAIVALLAAPATYNCIRLTYSVELFYLGANLTARQSFARLGLNDTISQVEQNNPTLLDLPLLAVRDAVVHECGAAGIMVLFDNQVSRSEWCCSTDDGNGWWNDAYFNVTEWLYSLQALSSHYAAIQPNAVAYSLRNELRTDKPFEQQVADWLYYVPQGVDALHTGDPTALVFVSGLGYDTDWTFLAGLNISGVAAGGAGSGSGSSSSTTTSSWPSSTTSPGSPSTAPPTPTAPPTAPASQYNTSEWQRVYTDYADKLVFETHIYSWSGYGTYTDNCSLILPAFDQRIGYPQQQDRPHVLTELGLNQEVYPNDETDYLYFKCVSQWILDNQLGFGIWLYAGRSVQMCAVAIH